MTGAEMLAYIKRTFKRTDKDTEIYEAMTDTVMDIRLRFKSEDFKFEAYASPSDVGDFKLALPDDFAHLIGDVTVMDTDNDNTYRPLKKISKQRYDELYFDRLASDASLRNTGIPIHFCLYGRELFVGPCVDKTSYRFQVNYTTEDAEEIASDTADVPFSERHRKTLKYGVMRELYLMLENYQEADAWGVLYETDLKRIIANDEENITNTGSIIYNGV